MDSFSLNGVFQGKNFVDSWTSDLAYASARNELLVLDRGNNRLVRIDLTRRAIIASIPVGRIPFGIALSPDGSRALVANVGLFEYPKVPGVTPTNLDSMMLQFPPYGIPSKAAEDGVRLPDGRFIPGLGSMLADEAMSVWVIDLNSNTVVSKLKTGYQIGSLVEDVEIVGGASPNSIAAGSRYAYVSNATNDLISVIDWKSGKLVREIKLKIDDKIDGLRGMMPFGLCLSSDEKTLYVALLGLNAVAVVDTRKNQVSGYIPAGWGTTRVLLSPDNQNLYILSARGHGAGPNGGQGYQEPAQGTYIGDIQLGTFQRVSVPDRKTLAAYTSQVRRNTYEVVSLLDDSYNPCPPVPGRKSPIRHIVYITKENRTFDEVFGQLNGTRRDSTLARFGENVIIKEGEVTVKNANVGVNHLAIARQWAISDNFYCDSDASIHGHHWMVGTVPNEYVEANAAAGHRFDAFSSAPGRRFPHATRAIDPEDYNERGGMWENFARHGISFYNFGECNEFSGNYEEKFDTVFGAAHAVPWPIPQVLFERTCRDYAGYNMNIPDQFRVDQFERNFRKMWLDGNDTMPAFVAIQLPNDHTSEPRPADGYPFRHSFVADNDLALGRMLEFLSKTPYWKSMLVIITEDDPQGGVDHVDAHRSVLLMAGPFVKQGYISHRHSNFGSILKVIYNILGIPYVNQYDQTASLIDDFFTHKPDFKTYRARQHDSRVFDAQKAMRVYNRDFNWRAVPGTGMKMDDPSEQREDHYRQKGGGQ